MIIGPCSDSKGIRQIKSGAVSDHHNLCSYSLSDDQLSFVMEMGKISAVTLKLVRDLIEPAYEALGWTPDDVDQFIPHQVGARPFLKTLKIVGVDEARSIATYPKLGNLASATIPVCFDLMQEQGRLKPGTNLLIGASRQRNCSDLHGRHPLTCKNLNYKQKFALEFLLLYAYNRQLNLQLGGN